MSTTVKCPNCNFAFEPEESFRIEARKEAEEKANKDAKIWKAKTEEDIFKKTQSDFEVKLSLLEKNNKEKDDKLKAAQQKEIEFLSKQQEIKTKESEIELTVQQKVQTELEKRSEELRKFEEQKSLSKETEHQLRFKELQKQIEDYKKLVDEMKRKSEQGSMQLQGEVQELALEELLKNSFPFDVINEVGKGVRGADCIQTIRNNFGIECGKIIFESKRTKDFSNEWIEKLKSDMRNQHADVAVLVTQVLPKEMCRFGEKDGIWICTFLEVKPLTQLLRDGILKLFAATKSNENKGDKMHLLYDYLNSSEFTEQWKAVREGFLSMKLSIQRERDAMEKLWKAREKQLEKVLLNATHIRGSIDGISGSDIDLNLLPPSEETETIEETT